MHRRDVQRHVRQYAASVGLNSNDEEYPDVISYFTRVERVHKSPSTLGKWILTLRRLIPLHDGSLKVTWWTEAFDAIVVAASGIGDTTYVPPIPGLEGWATGFPDQLFHARDYRRPEQFSNKVWALFLYVSFWVALTCEFALECAVSWRLCEREGNHKRALRRGVFGDGQRARTLHSSYTGTGRLVNPCLSRQPAKSVVHQLVQAKFHPNVTFIPELSAFENSPSLDTLSVRDASLLLANGSTIKGFDYVSLSKIFVSL